METSKPNTELPREATSGASRARIGRNLRWTAFFAVLAAGSLFAGFETARRTLPLSSEADTVATSGASQTASQVNVAAADKISDAQLGRLSTQDQAELLLARAIDRDERSLNLLREKADGWRGHLKNSDHLFDLVLAALNSRDLRIRTAAVDVDLAANNLSKSPATVERLLQKLQREPSERGMTLWRLGSLGNRGVEPEKVLTNLVNYAHDPSEHTRYWAVEGLAMLGNDAAISPLLDRLAHDRSSRVRERAASGLAQSGLLTREERLAAIPHLLNLADDDSLGANTRELVYGALRMITGAELGNDASAWRDWWAHHDPAQPHPHRRTNLLRA